MTTTTGADGTFRFAEAGARGNRLRVEAPGFAVAAVAGVAGGALRTPFGSFAAPGLVEGERAIMCIRRRAIREAAPGQMTKTLAHELALYFGGADLPSAEEETIAESVAYVVGRHFGIDSTGSPNYLALWDADSKTLKAHLERIVACSRQIITALEGQETPAKEVVA